MDRLNITSKNTGDVLNASEWNSLVDKTNEIVENINNTPSSGSGNSDSHIKYDATGKHNLTIETTAADQYEKNGEIKGGKINIEPISDLQIKPGDDIALYSHHRAADKQDEVAVKVLDGDDNPVKLQLNASEMTITTKGKVGENYNVFDINVNSEKNTKGYLKVRAQAIDLRSESHGGIALQPKGTDGTGNQNKIKFEHGGGDGLEFGTFNTEKTSIYTDEYRFKKDGIWKMATRQKVASDKADLSDPTTQFKYVKQSDDFYDVIEANDEQCTTNDIIKTANAFNNSKNRHAKYTEEVTSKGKLKKTLEIETVVTVSYTAVTLQGGETIFNSDFDLPSEIADVDKVYSISDFKDAVKTITVGGVIQKYGTAGDDGVTLSVGGIVMIGGNAYEITEHFAPSMDITSNAELSLKGKDKLSLGGGIVEFGSDSIDLGEMEDGLYAQYKLTKKNNSKACDVLKVKVINNQSTSLAFDSDSVNFSVDSFYPGSDVEHPASVTVPGKVEVPATE